MCSSYMCGELKPQPPDSKKEPWWYRIIDALIWVIWLLYQPWKYRKKIFVIVCLPAMLVTWPWWGYRYFKSVIQ